MTNTTTTLHVPDDFTSASSSYRFQAWMAMLGLLVFIILYVGLASWFTYTAYRMLSGTFAGGEGAVKGFFAALPSVFLAVFMWKALLFVRRGSEDYGVEIKRDTQPRLFAFLDALADSLRAPRPHRVFVSPNVNAAVCYDLSILNFLLPSKKNLIIGLGLVNSLNQSEFKAVLAHEFGHFAQRSMAVGRWVYVGEQIASHIIAKRDALDRLLDFISAIDIRVAWIGWIMRIIVWSIRSLMETVFRLVVIAHRALSRKMEFQADLVAVSATGSDAIVHALYRLSTADEDWGYTLDFATEQLKKGNTVQDLFAVQTRIGEHMRTVLNEPNRGQAPTLPVAEAASHRLFTEQLAQPPRMWSTHPPNTEREENAKRTYLPAPITSADAWGLFQDNQQLREDVSRFLFQDVKFEKEPQTLNIAEAISAVDDQFSRESYDPVYQGVYLGRAATLAVANPEDLYCDPPSRDQIEECLRGLYPDSLNEDLAHWRNLEEEIALLEAIQDGRLESSGNTIRHRGESIRRSQLPLAIWKLKQQRNGILAELDAHDQHCRTTHHVAARYVAYGWQEYLDGLTKLLHYAEHSESDLNDAHGQLANFTSMAIASGHVSNKKRERVMASANDLQNVMAKLDGQAKSVILPAALLEQLEIASWREALEEYKLPRADATNIGDWLNVVDSWAIPMRTAFGNLRRFALQELLSSERKVAQMFRGELDRSQAPRQCAEVPAGYLTRVRQSERERQTKLDWWSRFTLADGTAPTILRLAVAATIVAGVVFASAVVGNAKVTVYNGLSIPVNVDVNGETTSVLPFRHKTVSVGLTRSGTFHTETTDGRLIETFEENVERGFANYIYNVASAAPMVEWTAVYGNVGETPPRNLGCPRLRTTAADFVFQEPPRQIKMKSGSGGTRTVLTAYPDLHPSELANLVSSPSEQEHLIKTNARWGSGEEQQTALWLQSASELSGFDKILADRLATNPKDVLTLRWLQDTAEPEAKAGILAAHQELARANPNDPSMYYVGTRAMSDGPDKDAAFLSGLQKWPSSVWLSYACGFVHARHARWQQSLKCYELPLREKSPLYSGAAIQTARIRRLIAKPEAPNLSDLNESYEIKILQLLESGEGLQGTGMDAFSMLDQGKVQEAYQAGMGNNPNNSGLLVLLAASRGADTEWQRRALEIPIDEIQNPNLLLYLSAIAYKTGKPYESYLERFATQMPEKRQYLVMLIRQFFANPTNDLLLDDLDPEERGLVYATATIAMGERASEEWADAGRRLLFATERPFL